MTAVAVAVLVWAGLALVLSEWRRFTRVTRRRLGVLGGFLTLVGLVLAVGVLSGW